MCGIAGYVGTERLAEDRLERTLFLMRHRGPDQAAHEHHMTPAGANVHLLFTRLSIIDLDPRAGQPFAVGDKRLVFNGELYNYVELRRELERDGASFRTSSDTEVLLSAIDRRGWRALDAFEGMFAFAVYDAADGSTTLCRDRFGEKPLYLYRDATGLYFGSEAKLVAELLGRRLEVDVAHLYRYLVNGYKEIHKRRRTFFRGLHELAPGSVLRVGPDGEARQRRYWRPRPEQEPTMTYAEAVEGVRERLLRSVELRLRADVPLAFSMSGGVDSVSLISIAKRVFDYDVHGFTIGNTDARYEEAEMVDYAVLDLGIRHTSIPLDTRDFLPRLRELVRHHDAPVYTITYFAQWLLLEAVAAHGYRISISGTAADELFSGYFDHHLAYLYEVRNEPALHAEALAAWGEHIAPLVRNPFLRDADLFVRDPSFRDHIYLGAEDFAATLHEPWLEPFGERRYSDDLLRNRMLNELFHEAVPVILHEDDLNAMYFSVENRSPFLDRELFEFSQRIPTRHLVRNGHAKAVLRDAMAGIAPAPVLDNRRKVGFNAPIGGFLDVSDQAVRDELLADSPIWEHVRRDAVEAIFDRPVWPNSESKFLFYFLNSKLFLEEFA